MKSIEVEINPESIKQWFYNATVANILPSIDINIALNSEKKEWMDAHNAKHNPPDVYKLALAYLQAHGIYSEDSK